MAVQYSFGQIVTSGLVLALDAADRNSYVSGSLIWNDLSNINRSGSLINGPTFNTESGGSIVFDGTNDYARISSINASSQFTLNFWLNPTQSGSTGANEFLGIINDFNGLDTGANSGFTNRLLLSSSFSELWIQLDVSGTRRTVSSSIFTSIQNKNTMCTVTYNNSFVSFYINGTVISSSSLSGNIDIGTGTFNPTIGWGASNANYYYRGSIFVTQAYNRALSAQEVLQNYNAQKSRFNL